MSLHTKKLYYQREGVTYSINLYTDTADIGADYVSLRDGSTTVYAALGDVSDVAASHMRIQKSDVTKAVLEEVAPMTINLAAIPGVVAPVAGAVPVTTPINSSQYMGTISWSPAHGTFQQNTIYSANIALTAKPGYTLVGVPANFFTVNGKTCTNAANSGNVTVALIYVVRTLSPKIAGAMYHSIGLKSSTFAVVAVGTQDPEPVNVSGWTNVTQVTAGSDYSAGLTSSNTVYVASAPGTISNAQYWSNIIQLAGGWGGLAGLQSNGTVVYVGSNSSTINANIAGWTNIVQVQVTEAACVGLKSDGTVVVTPGDLSAPGWTNIIQIAAGDQHLLGLKADGTVVAVGQNNYYNQLYVSGWTGIVQVAAGLNHSLGLRSNNTVVATGSDIEGQVNTSSWSNIIQIAAGDYHSLGLKSDGTVLAVGKNTTSQCNVSTWNLA